MDIHQRFVQRYVSPKEKVGVWFQDYAPHFALFVIVCVFLFFGFCMLTFRLLVICTLSVAFGLAFLLVTEGLREGIGQRYRDVFLFYCILFLIALSIWSCALLGYVGKLLLFSFLGW